MYENAARRALRPRPEPIAAQAHLAACDERLLCVDKNNTDDSNRLATSFSDAQAENIRAYPDLMRRYLLTRPRSVSMAVVKSWTLSPTRI